VKAEDFVRTIPNWWPAIAPKKLEVFAAQGLEAAVASAAGRYLPWLRRLQCDNRLAIEDHDDYLFEPLSAELVGLRSAPGLLPKLKDLRLHVVYADSTPLRALANSALISQLDYMFIEVRFLGTADFQHLWLENARAEIALLLERLRSVPPGQ
jgi:hypothetical protein